MRLFLLAVGVLSLSVQTLAAPNNTQLNDKIKTLKDRVSFLEDTVADLKKSSTVYVFAGFTEEEVDPLVPDAFIACRSEYGPKASIATTREIFQALRNGTFLADSDGYVLSSEAQYNMGVARDKYLLEVLNGSFIVVGVGGKTSHMTVGEAPVACSMPL
ncbi:MAG: hypothetical protein DRR04_10720 [Gammaproteobacteria bacterium]|nr:MAG: hypothetical protein DRR04_10720 [Gammaproteobacteria bacterium]